MTLRDKFRKADRFSVTKISLDVKCEKIADDYAIDFAEWLNSGETEDLIYSLQMVGELNKNPKKKELLEIFKKEKGL